MWKPLIFVDNIVDNGSSMCISWGWYIQNDVQIFIFSLFLLAIFKKNRFLGFSFIWLSILLSVGFNFYEAEINQYKVNTHMSDFSNWGQYFIDIYIKPWTRCPPYLFGLFLGVVCA